MVSWKEYQAKIASLLSVGVTVGVEKHTGPAGPGWVVSFTPTATGNLVRADGTKGDKVAVGLGHLTTFTMLN